MHSLHGNLDLSRLHVNYWPIILINYYDVSLIMYVFIRQTWDINRGFKINQYKIYISTKCYETSKENLKYIFLININYIDSVRGFAQFDCSVFSNQNKACATQW